MLERMEGRVLACRALGRRSVQLELEGIARVVELTVSEAWVIRPGERLAVAGEVDRHSGKFIGYAYRNLDRGVAGRFDAHPGQGLFLVAMGLLFCWALFPLFVHVPAGLAKLARAARVRRAVALLERGPPAHAVA